MVSAAALALGMLAGASLGAHFAGLGAEEAGPPTARRGATTVSDPVFASPPGLAVPIALRG
jgi:hypothetical protein